MISKNKIKLIRSLSSKKGRDKAGLFVAEGPKVCHDLQAAGFHAQMLLDDEEDVRLASFLQHPQGTLGVFEIPKWAFIPPNASDLYLALDGVQDPGNLGTIIRIADWFGIRTIYCSMDTADCWNPKVVQATMGSLARVHIYYTDLVRLLANLDADYPIYGTLLDGNDLYASDLSNHGIIIMGNEGNGISPAISERITHRLLIPSYPKGVPTAESLNVAIATAITCAEFRRRAPQKH